MQSQANIEQVAIDLLARQNLRLVSCRSLQSLWAGYGHICHILAAPMADGAVVGLPEDDKKDKKKKKKKKEDTQSSHVSLILKYITPPHVNRGSKPDEGHTRKLLSYQIELSFYTHLAPDLPPDIAVAACRASLSSGRNADLKTAMLLTDLRPAFPVAGGKRAALAEAQVYGALRWLAGFHGHWWPRVGTLDRGGLVRPPLEHFARHGNAVVRDPNAGLATATTALGGGQSARVWLNGGYTYLQTRRGEYADLCEDGGTEWSEALCRPVGGREESLAELVARVLAPCAEDGVSPYETLIHGDVKSENLFTSEEGDKVAFFDFQYVGLGLGVCDLAKLFTCSVPRSMLGLSRAQQQPMDGREEKLLRFYLERLRQVSGKEYEWDALVRHWEAALVDWLRFQASWGFWGNTEWLEGRVRSGEFRGYIWSLNWFGSHKLKQDV